MRPLDSERQMMMDAIRIENLDDLKAMISSTLWAQAVQSEGWVQRIASSLQWEVRLSRRFLLHCYIDFHDEDDALFTSFLQECEQICDQVEQFLQIEPRSKQEKLLMQSRFILFVVKTRSSRTFGSLPDPHTMFYLLDPRQDPNYMRRFRHEIAHWVWGHLYGEAPPLFQEGVATYADSMSEPGADASEFLRRHPLDVEQLPPLCDLALTENFWSYNAESGRHASGQPLYVVASLWIHFLVEKWGWDKLKHLFLISDYEDHAIADHFSEVYGRALGDVDVEWRREQTLEASRGAPPTVPAGRA
jgi:hypothetical protein